MRSEFYFPTEVSQVVQTNSATSEQCAAASEELSNQATRMRDLLSIYNLGTGHSRIYRNIQCIRRGTDLCGRGTRCRQFLLRHTMAHPCQEWEWTAVLLTLLPPGQMQMNRSFLLGMDLENIKTPDRKCGWKVKFRPHFLKKGTYEAAIPSTWSSQFLTILLITDKAAAVSSASFEPILTFEIESSISSAVSAKKVIHRCRI